MNIKIEIPLGAIEPLFTALHNIRPMEITRLEAKALGLLKTSLYYELEAMMETPEEKELRRIDFQKIFGEERKNKQRGLRNSKKGYIRNRGIVKTLSSLSSKRLVIMVIYFSLFATVLL